MQYYSTSDNSYRTDLTRAIVHCVAPDGGLYMPASWPTVPKAFFNNIDQLSLTDIAYVVANSLLGDDVDGAVLKKSWATASTSRSLSWNLPTASSLWSCSTDRRCRSRMWAHAFSRASTAIWQPGRKTPAV